MGEASTYQLKMAGPASSVSGKSWDCWPADDAADEGSLTSSSGSSSTVSSGTATPIGEPSSPSQTPLLVRRHHPSSSDDVMKLPRKDMKIFGEFPGRDDFLLVLCDTCHRYIKAEAFEAHCRQRHDFVGRQGGGRAVVSASASTRGKAAQLRSCTVELTKEDLFPLSSSSSSATTAETSSSAATTMVSSPAASLTKEEPMDESNPVMMVNPVPSESRTALAPPTPMEEADSTTANNVISIPDTDPLPAMSNELMAMVSGDPVIIPKSDISATNPPSGGDSTSARVGGGGKRGPAAAFQISPHSVIKLQINPPPPPLPPPALPTHPNPPSPAANKKASPGKKAASLLAVGGGGVVGGAGGGRQDRRALQREYNPDKHCGVWDNESKRHCTRALTCKSHSVLLKRNIQGRSKSFDDLVQEHKAQKEAQQAAAAALAGAAAAAAASGPAPLRTTSRPPPGVLANAESVLSSITEPNPIDPRFSIPTSTNGIRIKPNSSSYVPPVAAGAKMTAVSTNLNGSKKSLLCLSSPPSKESDENVIYTTDHPKPLAVCTFGGRRVGGLLVTDRSQFLTRKVVRVAISAGGFHRIRPASRLNELKFGNNVIRRPGAGGGGGGVPAIPTNARIVTAAPGLAATANNYLVNYNLAPTAVVQAAGQALPQQPTAVATASAAAAAAARVMTSVTVAGPTSVAAGAPTSLAIAPQIGRVAVNLAPLPPNAVVATSGLPPGINIATASDATFKTELQDFKGGIKFELGRNMKPILPTSSDVAK